METEAKEDKEGSDAEGDRDRETPRGATVPVTRVGGDVTPPMENADLLGFTPERAHRLLQGVYGYFPHHNYGSHLYRGIVDDALWQCCWCRLSAHSASWYATPFVVVGRRFT